ncbi:GNAT family N-acetyltransferase [Thalassiella azotivora]
MADTSTQVRRDDDRSRYEAVVDGEVAGYVELEQHEDRVVLTHTVVEDAYEGRGVGSALVRGALDDLRDDGRTVVPQCPFAASWIERHPEYQDLLS